jgi:hypothetical protein
MKKLVFVFTIAVSNLVFGQRIEMSTPKIFGFEALNEEFDIRNTWAFFDNSATNSFNMPFSRWIQVDESMNYLEIIDFNKKIFYRTFMKENGELFEQEVPMIEIYEDGDIKSCLVQLLDSKGLPVNTIISIRMNELRKTDMEGPYCIMFVTQHESGGVVGKLYNFGQFNSVNKSGYGNISVKW